MHCTVWYIRVHHHMHHHHIHKKRTQDLNQCYLFKFLLSSETFNINRRPKFYWISAVMNKAVIYLCRQARACSGRQTFLQLRADSFTQCKGGTVYHGHHLHQSVRFMSFVSADPSLVVHQHDAVDVTAVLARWPSPDERGAINETVYLLQDDTYLIDQALKHNIDKGEHIPFAF